MTRIDDLGVVPALALWAVSLSKVVARLLLIADGSLQGGSKAPASAPAADGLSADDFVGLASQSWNKTNIELFGLQHARTATDRTAIQDRIARIVLGAWTEALQHDLNSRPDVL